MKPQERRDKGLHSSDSIRFLGERGRNRTFNLLIKSQLLCQLSYAPACEETLQKGDISITPRTRVYGVSPHVPLGSRYQASVIRTGLATAKHDTFEILEL